MLELNAKAHFLASEDAKRHVDFVRAPWLRGSLQAALCQMVLRLPDTSNPTQSWNNACRIEGARDFIKIWLNLAEEDKPIDRQTPPLNLKRDPNL